MLSQEANAMPYCTHCGNQVNDGAAFCAKCGVAQPGTFAQPPRPSADFLDSINPTTASILCYVPFVGWIAALVVLASQRFQSNRTARFHAFQGLYLFVLWILIDIALGATFGFAGIAARRLVTRVLKLAVLAGSIYMLVKTSQGEFVRLPVLGDLADSSISEQNSTRP
jgi:uncharacterized membrane protein